MGGSGTAKMVEMVCFILLSIVGGGRGGGKKGFFYLQFIWGGGMILEKEKTFVSPSSEGGGGKPEMPRKPGKKKKSPKFEKETECVWGRHCFPMVEKKKREACLWLTKRKRGGCVPLG